MINMMTKPLSGRYESFVVRNWNFDADRPELWLMMQFGIAADGCLENISSTRRRLSDEAALLIGRLPQVVKPAEELNVDYHPVKHTLHWVAGPITEQEAAHIKELSDG